MSLPRQDRKKAAGDGIGTERGGTDENGFRIFGRLGHHLRNFGGELGGVEAVEALVAELEPEAGAADVDRDLPCR